MSEKRRNIPVGIACFNKNDILHGHLAGNPVAELLSIMSKKVLTFLGDSAKTSGLKLPPRVREKALQLRDELHKTSPNFYIFVGLIADNVAAKLNPLVRGQPLQGNDSDAKTNFFIFVSFNADNVATKLPLVMWENHLQGNDAITNSDIWEGTTSKVENERMTHEADSKLEEKREEKKDQEDLAWDERDWDEKDPLYALDDEDEEDFVSKRGKKVSEKKTKNNAPLAHEDASLVGKVLLIIVANYIRPEDITNFSCVCKTASMITRSVYFWKNLYFRYYNSSTALPPYLQPEQIERTGLRTFVIRALYYLYEPYRLALNTTSPVGEGLSLPEAITDFTCLYTWYHGEFGHPYTHFMKLRLCSKEGVCYNPNISANDNHGECILRVYCEHFQDVPSAKIMGLQLVKSSVSVSDNMRHYRVKLEFGRKSRRGSYVKSSIIPVFLDPVLKVDVLHWWHPQFNKTLQISTAENAANTK